MSAGQANLLSILQDRVGSLFAEGKLDEALRVATTALDSARRNAAEGPEAIPQLITSLEMLGDIDRHLGNFSDAEALYREALEHTEAHGAPTEQIATLQSSLATLYDFNGLEEQAIPLYENAIALYEAAEPPLLVEAANLRNNLAMIYKVAGQTDPAEQHYLAALQIFEASHGHDNELVAAVYNNLGALY